MNSFLRIWLYATVGLLVSLLLAITVRRTLLAQPVSPKRSEIGQQVKPTPPLTNGARAHSILALGDSMAHFCPWTGVVTLGFPTRTIWQVQQEIDHAYSSGQIPEHIDTTFVLVGTAGASFPVGWSFDMDRELPQSTSPERVNALVNSPEKLSQFLRDFDALIRDIKAKFHCDRFVIVSPFPNLTNRNFWLIKQADDALSAKYGNEYFDLNDIFYDFETGTRRNSAMFRDEFHLTELGYELLEEELEKAISARSR